MTQAGSEKGPDMVIDFDQIVPRFDSILTRGLSSGLGNRDGQMCIEAAVCAALDLPHGDDPQCVSPAVRGFKIALNDSTWSSTKARAEGLRKLGIAQLGSRGVIDDAQFVAMLSGRIIKEMIPTLYRRGAAHFAEPHKTSLLAAADRCEAEGTPEAAAEAAEAAWAAEAAEAARATEAARAARAAWAARAARAARAAWAAWAAEAARAAWAARAAEDRMSVESTPDLDYYLKLVASFALDILTTLENPGALWLRENEATR